LSKTDPAASHANDTLSTLDLQRLTARAEGLLAEHHGWPRALGNHLDAVRGYGALLSARAVGRAYNRLPEAVLQRRDELSRAGGAGLVAAFHRLVILDAAARSRAMMRAQPMFADVRPWFEQALSAICRDLFSTPDHLFDFSHDGFSKDVSIATLRIWPLGAQVVEPRMGISRRILVEGGLATFRSALEVFSRMRGHVPLYEIHTYERSLAEFNQQGWIDCYRRIARLLVQEPEVKGVFGASWFYDPQLAQVSPRLTYLRADPIAGGATFMRVSATPQTSSLATSKSATRKKLFDDGTYVPKQYLMVWPRDRILEWARGGDLASPGQTGYP